MVEGCDIAAGHRCDDRSSQDPKTPVFVPPRPRNRRRQGKGDSRAGYWCRCTTYLARKVAVASHEAREAKRLVQVVQVAREAHERQLQQLRGQVQALQELFAGVASAKGDGLMATHTHTPHPHTPEGARSGSSRGSAEGSSPSTDLECGGSPGGVRAWPRNVDCDSDGSRVMVVQAMQGQLQELKEKETREQLRAARPKAVQQLQAAVRGHQGRRWAHFRDPERAARRLQAAIRGRYQSVRVLNGKRRDGTYCYYWDCYVRHLHVFAHIVEWGLLAERGSDWCFSRHGPAPIVLRFVPQKSYRRDTGWIYTPFHRVRPLHYSYVQRCWYSADSYP